MYPKAAQGNRDNYDNPYVKTPTRAVPPTAGTVEIRAASKPRPGIGGPLALPAAAAGLNAQDVDDFSPANGIHPVDQIADHAGVVGNDAELVAHLRRLDGIAQVDEPVFLAQASSSVST